MQSQATVTSAAAAASKVTFSQSEMQRVREERDVKRSQLDERHAHLLSMVALCLGIEPSDAEDSILDGNQIELMNKFFESDGSRQLTFCQQQAVRDEHHTVQLLKVGEGSAAAPRRRKSVKFTPKLKLFVVTDNTRFTLQQDAVVIVFAKSKLDIAITNENIVQEVSLTVLDTKNGLLPAIEGLMSHVYKPSFERHPIRTEDKQNFDTSTAAKFDFLRSVDAFVQSLINANEIVIANTLTLSASTSSLFDPSLLAGPHDCLQAASSQQMVEAVEETVSVWIKQISLILAESEQVRRDTGNQGPVAELEFWKRRVARFAKLIEEMKSQPVKATISVLQIAKSKLFAEWKAVDGRATDIMNESKDNVKFLSIIEKLCDPLYNSDPVGMLDLIPGVLNATRMIYSVSNYYNTSERMTYLFIKISNQMIIACKSHVTNAGRDSLWNQSTDVVLNKLTNCLKLYEAYKSAYHVTKQQLENDTKQGQKFDFSETLIFGKFDKLSRRLHSIVEFMETAQLCQRLKDVNVEGVAAYVHKLDVVVGTMKRKSYDWLDQLQAQFDIDFEEFKLHIADIQLQMIEMINGQFNKVKNMQNALQLVRKFDRISLPGWNVGQLYPRLLQLYMADIEAVAKIYQETKSQPDIARDLPPVAGRISWTRQLHRRIEEPITQFQSYPSMLNSQDGKKAIRMYNKMSKVLVEYEMLYYKCWLDQIDAARSGIAASLLVRNAETNRLHINFDSQVFSLFREAEYISQFGLDVPQSAKLLIAKQPEFKQLYSTLALLLREVDRIQQKIPPHLSQLMQPHVDEMYDAFEPGLNTLNWLSVNLQMFFDSVRKSLKQFELLVERIQSLIEIRIEGPMRMNTAEILCEVPVLEIWTIDNFVSHTEHLCNKGMSAVRARTLNIEDAVSELLTMLVRSPDEVEDSTAELDEVERKKLLKAKRDQKLAEESLVQYFHNRYVDSLVKLAKNSLEVLKKRVSSNNGGTGPLFRCNALLSIPKIVEQPTLDEIQHGLMKSVHCILDVFSNIPEWSIVAKSSQLPGTRSNTGTVTGTAGRDRWQGSSESSVHASKPSGEDDVLEEFVLGNYFAKINEHKDVNKLVALLSASVNLCKKDVSTFLGQFYDYKLLWTNDRGKELKEFIATDPQLLDFEEKIKFYEQLELKVKDGDDYFNVGPISIYVDQLKLGLVEEIKQWKKCYAVECSRVSRARASDTLTVINDYMKKLNRPIRDLEDVRTIMRALSDLRQREVTIDMSIGPIEESYVMLAQHGHVASRDELERVDALRYNWQLLQNVAQDTTAQLTSMEQYFRQQLMDAVHAFTDEFTLFCDDYYANGPMVVDLPQHVINERLDVFQTRFDNLWEKYLTNSSSEQLFGLQVTEFPELHKIRKELELLQKLYALYNDVLIATDGFSEINWSDINIEKISKQFEEFNARCQKLPRSMKDWPTYLDLKEVIRSVVDMIPLLEQMSNKALVSRHWEKIQQLTQHAVDSNATDTGFTLSNVIDFQPMNFREQIEDICVSAVKEQDLDRTFQRIIEEWNTRTFKLASFKNRGEILLHVDATNNIAHKLEDSVTVLMSLFNSRYSEPFAQPLCDWIQKLSDTLSIVEMWLTVQDLWVYLDSVYTSSEIIRQLPQETKRFSNVDKSWMRVVAHVKETPNVLKCCSGDDFVKRMLLHLLEQLEQCKKSLNGYLEKKRSQFARFCFVSDSTLLEILGQSGDLNAIQSHLLGVFSNIKTLNIDSKRTDLISAVTSSEGETLELNKPVKAEGGSEVWLANLLKAVQETVHYNVRSAALTMQESSVDWIEFLNSYPTQVCVLCLQLAWTKDVTEMLKAVPSLNRKIIAKTTQSVESLVSLLVEQLSVAATSTERAKFESLATVHIHQRDVCNEMVRQCISSVSDFEWQKQLRVYFLEESDRCLINITDVSFQYQNEFLGCFNRLVLSPLTERCYISLAQAVRLSYGAVLVGPSATGKTETVKDMAHCLGKHSVSISCSAQTSYRAIGRLFEGLVRSGCWLCFDDFNTLNVSLLSVAAQLASCIFTAKKEHRAEVVLMHGEPVNVNAEFGCFMTLASPEVYGRLPENLKSVFRPIALTIPDRQIILRVKLASFGFTDSHTLAAKVDVLYKLCGEQLAVKQQYDFGLRNVVSLLRALSQVKADNMAAIDSEMMLVGRIVRDINLPKIDYRDEALFISLVNDVFPGFARQSPVKTSLYQSVDTAVHQIIEKTTGLVDHTLWTAKILQLYEVQDTRNGVIVIGPSGCGKTSCIQVLMKALTQCGQPHRELRLNPMVMSVTDMYGTLDANTNEWTDGVFTALWRRCSIRHNQDEHNWLVLDGSVASSHMEMLNPVLDNTRTLSLANGDRLLLSENCRILFEVDAMCNSSPSLVSRCGVVCFNDFCLEWKQILQGWLQTRPAAEHGIISNIFESTYDDILKFAKENVKFQVSVLDVFLVRQTCSLLEAIIPLRDQREVIVNRIGYERFYIFAVVWSIGALLNSSDRQKLEQFLRSNNRLRFELPSTENNFTVYDFRVEDSGTLIGSWCNWNIPLDEFLFTAGTAQMDFSTFVPSVDSLKKHFLIDCLMRRGKAAMLAGPAGTAKTSIISNYLSKSNSNVQLSKVINLTSSTTPRQLQSILESWLEKRMGNTYGPMGNKSMSLFIDDVSFSSSSDNQQQTCEFIRQLLDAKGFYSFDKPGEFSNVVDIKYVAAERSQGIGFHDLPMRLKRHFSFFHCNVMSNQLIDRIFGSMANSHYNRRDSGYTSEVSHLAIRLVAVTRILWQTVKDKMLPTPNRSYYHFALRDLSLLWYSMMSASSSVITDQTVLMSLWHHECQRVLADRLSTEEDRLWFAKTMYSICSTELGTKLAEVTKQPQHFVDFIRPENEDENSWEQTVKVYQKVESMAVLSSSIQYYLTEYNETFNQRPMNLVLFDYAVNHLVRISRILRTRRQHGLLIGTIGTGRRSLTRLAAYIAQHHCLELPLNRTYSVAEFLDDLKSAYLLTGKQGKEVTLLVTEYSRKDELIMEYINNILLGQIVPGVLQRDVSDDLLRELVPTMEKQFPDTATTSDNLLAFFESRIVENLHVVLCFSPDDKLNRYLLRYPGLLSRCTIDWFSQWPVEGLVLVAHRFVQDFHAEIDPKTRNQISLYMAAAYHDVVNGLVAYNDGHSRTVDVTVTSYLSFIQTYKELYLKENSFITRRIEQLGSGLSKLQEASGYVSDLMIELKQKELVLEEYTEAANNILRQVEKKQEEVDAIQVRVQEAKYAAQLIIDDIEADNLTVTEEMQAAMPVLFEIDTIIENIGMEEIESLRKLRRPNGINGFIMDCVLLLLQRKIKPVQLDTDEQTIRTSWREALTLLTDENFLAILDAFPKDCLNAETVELMLPYLEMEEVVRDRYVDCLGNFSSLVKWIKALIHFSSINKRVLPLKTLLAIKEAKLAKAIEKLNIQQTHLDDAMTELSIVTGHYREAMQRRQVVLDDVEQFREKTTAAGQLVDSLDAEKTKWTDETKELQRKRLRLVGDVLLCSAFLSYCGPFDFSHRKQLLECWLNEINDGKIPHSPDTSAYDKLTNIITVSKWQLKGLPRDEFFTQNAAIVTSTKRVPVFIDPEQQGYWWILKLEEPRNIEVTQFGNRNFRSVLEKALSLGRPLLIENVDGDNFDLALIENVLSKNYITSAGSVKVNLAGWTVDVVDGFVLYMTTCVGIVNPKFPVEISSRVLFVDFTMTPTAVENVILSSVVSKLKPDTEHQRVKLVEEIAQYRQTDIDIAENLLQTMIKTPVCIAKDADFIEVCETTKITEAEFNHKLKTAKDLEFKMNSVCERYRPIAVRGRLMYSVLVEMKRINHMYHMSLENCIEAIVHSTTRAERSKVVAQMNENVIKLMTFDLCLHAVQSFYDADKLTFMLLLALKIDLLSGKLSVEEFTTFIAGGSSNVNASNSRTKPFSWIPDASWQNLVALSSLKQFSGVLDKITCNESHWKAWFDKDLTESETLPDGYDLTLDSFNKLLLIRSCVPERTLSAVYQYIAEALGEVYIKPAPDIDLLSLWQQVSHSRKPIIGLLSPGCDPSYDIQQIAKKHKIHIHTLSLGQGEDEVYCQQLLNDCLFNGDWLLLQNCHLSINLTTVLCQNIIRLADSVHSQFRLWITVQPIDSFPCSILQVSTRYTFDKPRGIRNGLRNTWMRNFIDEVTDNNIIDQFKPILFNVAMLHNIVNDRCRYGTAGWNKSYEFSDADLLASIRLIEYQLDDTDPKKGVNWTCIQYLMSEVLYGGRVHDDVDRQLLKTLSQSGFNEVDFQSNVSFHPAYRFPFCNTVDEYNDFFDELKDLSTADVLELSPTVETYNHERLFEAVLSNLQLLQSVNSAALSRTAEYRETVVSRLCHDLLGKLPGDFVINEVRSRMQRIGALQPLNAYLRREIELTQTVLTSVRQSLTHLQSAFAGHQFLSESLLETVNDLFQSRVPSDWIKLSWPRSSVTSWALNLIEHVKQLKSWCFEGRPKAFYITGFIHIRGLFNAILQEGVKAHKGWSMESVILNSEVLREFENELTESPADGVYVHGFYLQNACWDRRASKLTESKSNIRYNRLPVVHLFADKSQPPATATADSSAVSGTDTYSCPVYRNQSHDGLLANISLKTAVDHKHWQLNGTALLCDTQ